MQTEQQDNALAFALTLRLYSAHDDGDFAKVARTQRELNQLGWDVRKLPVHVPTPPRKCGRPRKTAL